VPSDVQLFVQAVHIMTFSDCRADLVGQLDRDKQEGMLQIDAHLCRKFLATTWMFVLCLRRHSSDALSCVWKLRNKRKMLMNVMTTIMKMIWHSSLRKLSNSAYQPEVRAGSALGSVSTFCININRAARKLWLFFCINNSPNCMLLKYNVSLAVGTFLYALHIPQSVLNVFISFSVSCLRPNLLYVKLSTNSEHVSTCAEGRKFKL